MLFRIHNEQNINILNAGLVMVVGQAISEAEQKEKSVIPKLFLKC